MWGEIRAYISPDLTFITVCIYSYSNKIDVFVIKLKAAVFLDNNFENLLLLKKIMITEVFPNCYLKRLGPSISTILLPFIKFERQPSKGVLRKSSSESIQHIYRRTPNRNKAATQFLKQLFCKRRCDFFFATLLKQYTEHNVINFGGYFIYGGRSSPMSDAAQITSIP